MCLLTYTLPGEWPDLQKLEDASLTNSDGFGWSIVSDGRLVRGASLSIDEALTTYNVALRAHGGSSLFHLRWATHGAKDLTNVHPFPSDRGRTVIAHNGIISKVRPIGSESDTAAFVRRYWPSWANSALDTPESFTHLERWIGRGNKLVILTTDPRYKLDHYIANESEGHWLDGTWYSNHSYQWCDYRSSYTPYSQSFYGGKSYVIINGVKRELTGAPMPECKGYANGCQCLVCDNRDRGEDDIGDGIASLEFYPLKCGVCREEYIVSADEMKPTCPTCGVCWYCDSDAYACICGGGEI